MKLAAKLVRSALMYFALLVLVAPASANGTSTDTAGQTPFSWEVRASISTPQDGSTWGVGQAITFGTDTDTGYTIRNNANVNASLTYSWLAELKAGLSGGTLATLDSDGGSSITWAAGPSGTMSGTLPVDVTLANTWTDGTAAGNYTVTVHVELTGNSGAKASATHTHTFTVQ